MQGEVLIVERGLWIENRESPVADRQQRRLQTSAFGAVHSVIITQYLARTSWVVKPAMAILLIIGHCRPSSNARADDPPPMWDPAGIDDFEFTERSGQTVTKRDLLGRPWLACFVFTRCAGPCPRVTEQMKKLQDQLQDTNVQLVTFGVDPDHDTLEVLRKYADFWRADADRWWFLTGDKATLYRFIEKSFRVPVVETEGEDRRPGFEVIHSTNIMFVDGEGRVRAKFNATKDDDMAKLRRVALGKDPLLPVGVSDKRLTAPDDSGPVLKLDPVSGSIRFQPGSPDSERVDAAESTDATELPPAPGWVTTLPAVNAALNGLSTLLLIAGLACIKAKRVTAHKTCMLTAFATSVLFLACYLTYHFALRHFTGSSSKRFDVEGIVRLIYLTILLTHVVLAAVVPVLAVITIYRGLAGQWERHRRLARITFPIWLYVSVTGVIIYLMLYHWPKG